MKILGEWLVLSERVINDSLTQNLTLVSCIEQIATPSFPSHHQGFAVAARYRCVGEPPPHDVEASYRLVRLSVSAAPEVLVTFNGAWPAGTRRARVATNFRFLRLTRPEVLTFRVDHRIGRGRWIEGPSSSIDIVKLELTLEQQAALAADWKRLGLPGEAPKS